MRYALLGLTIVLVMLGTVRAPAYEGEYTKAQRQTCKMRGNDRWSKEESRDVERCVAAKVEGVTAAEMLNVAACESGHNAYAVSESGTFRGLFQHHREYWPTRVRSAQKIARRELGAELRAGVFNARSNAFVTAVMVKRSGWGAWSCA